VRTRWTCSSTRSRKSSSSPGPGVIASGSTPSLQFANSGGPTQSTLSGQAIDGFETFVGAGIQVQASATIGYFLRF
jgi:hypothetical protein